RGEREWFGPTGVDLLVRLHAEHANLRAALDFYLTASGEPVLAMRLAAALWFYWANSGPFAEARYWLDRTLAIEGEPMPYRAKALWVAGYAAILDNDLDRADRLLDEAARLAGAAGDHWLR